MALRHDPTQGLLARGDPNRRLMDEEGWVSARDLLNLGGMKRFRMSEDELHMLVMESNEVKLRYETYWQQEKNAEEGSDYEEVPGVWYYRAVQRHSTGVSDHLDMDTDAWRRSIRNTRNGRTRRSTARARKRCRI